MNNWQDNIHALENLDEDGGDDLTLSEEVEEFRRRQERREKQRAGREKKRAQKLLLKEQKKQEEQKRRIEAEKAALSLREEGARKLTRAEKKLAKKALKRQRRESGETREKRAGVVRRILGFVEVTQKDHIPAYATEAAFFLIMSFIPFLLFMITLLRYTSLSYNALRTAIITVVPENFQSFVLEIVVDVYRRNSAVAPISALAMLWAAGKGVQAITNGLNVIYHVKETRSWLITRIYCIFYIVLFAIAIIVSLLLMVLGRQIQALVSEYSPFLGNVLGRILDARLLLVFAVLFLVFLLLFKFLPNRKTPLRSLLPGAFITAVAWMVFSFFFSLYYEIFPNDINNMYGNLTSFIIMMMWVYFCMNMMLMGAECNIYFEKEFRKAHNSVQTRIKEKVRKDASQEKPGNTIFEEEDDFEEKGKEVS